jgi:hypothetical protein
MSAHVAPLAYHRVRAPSESGRALVVPPLDAVQGMLAMNRGWLAEWSTASDGLGPTLAALRTAARGEMVQAATQYTRQYRDVASHAYAPAVPLLLSGHQPQLFHAGVWFKNFVLSSLARSHQAVGVNLIVDNDTIRTATIRVPTGSPEAPLVENVALDAPSDEIPFEERTVLDAPLFRSFAERAAAAIRPWISCPLVADLWRHAIAAERGTSRLGEVLANARHSLEGEWGQATLELPLSAVARQAGFRRFALLLLQELPRFAAVYNTSLVEYRRVNRIRSRSHPVPNLADDDGWQEAPFWIWSSDQPRRQRLFVRYAPEGLQLTDRGRLQAKLAHATDSALADWEVLEQRGVRIRPRALTTTMYARLVLSDLFLHGIGGAKYDELTDAIVQRFFGIDPPAYLTATATIQLPHHFTPTSREEVLSLQHQQRALRFNPERFRLAGDAAQLVAQKQELLRSVPPRGSRRAWQQEMSRLNAELQTFAVAQQRELAAAVDQAKERYRRTRLLGSREFSFCLFPADFLRSLLLDLSATKP